MKDRKHHISLTILASCLLSLICLESQAQNVTKADFRQEGESIIISYHLDQKADISVYISTDYGENFTGPLVHVSGDVGKNVPAGENTIVWDPVAEYGGLTEPAVCFKVIARTSSSHSSPDTSRTRLYDDPFVRFGIGAGIGGMSLGRNLIATWHIPVEVLLGRSSNFLNFAISETFTFFKNTVQFTTLATLRARLSILYAGIGGGLNVNIYTEDDGFMEAYEDSYMDEMFDDMYEHMYGDLEEKEIPTLPKLSGMLQIELGINTRHYDASLFFRYDFYGPEFKDYDIFGIFGIAFKYYF